MWDSSMLLCYPAYVRTQSFVNPLDEDAGQDVETPPPDSAARPGD
jgi:hypothetical protein